MQKQKSDAALASLFVSVNQLCGLVWRIILLEKVHKHICKLLKSRFLRCRSFLFALTTFFLSLVFLMVAPLKLVFIPLGHETLLITSDRVRSYTGRQYAPRFFVVKGILDFGVDM